MRRWPRFYSEHVVKRDTPRDQEERIADAVGGSRVPGSGSSLYAKGDAKSGGYEFGRGDFLIEAKQTEHGSLSVKRERLEKITIEAEAEGKYPALAIEIKGLISKRKNQAARASERDWVAVPLSVFRRLIGEI